MLNRKHKAFYSNCMKFFKKIIVAKNAKSVAYLKVLYKLQNAKFDRKTDIFWRRIHGILLFYSLYDVYCSISYKFP